MAAKKRRQLQLRRKKPSPKKKPAPKKKPVAKRKPTPRSDGASKKKKASKSTPRKSPPLSKRERAARDKAKREKLSKAAKSRWRKIKKAAPASPVAKAEKKRRKKLSKTLREHTSAADKKRAKKLAAEAQKERRRLQRETKGQSLSVRAKIERVLANIIGHTSAEGRLDSAKHADGSMDLEARIAIPRGVNGKDVLLEVAPYVIPPPGTWVTIGWVFSPNKAMSEEEYKRYERFHKYLQVHAHYQRSERSAYNIVGALRIYDKLSAAGRRKVEQLFIRVHWSPSGERPD